MLPLEEAMTPHSGQVIPRLGHTLNHPASTEAPWAVRPSWPGGTMPGTTHYFAMISSCVAYSPRAICFLPVSSS